MSQPVLETTRMLDGLRQFQFISQFIQAEGDRQQSVITTPPPRHGATWHDNLCRNAVYGLRFCQSRAT